MPMKMTETEKEAERERLLAALLAPTLDVMKRAGIARMGIYQDGSIVLQMEAGGVVTIDPQATQ